MALNAPGPVGLAREQVVLTVLKISFWELVIWKITKINEY